jgi:hypothetical protein
MIAGIASGFFPAGSSGPRWSGPGKDGHADTDVFLPLLSDGVMRHVE